MLELHVKNKQTKDAESKTFIQNTTKTEQTNGKLQIKKMVSEQQRFQPNRTVAERQCEASHWEVFVYVYVCVCVCVCVCVHEVDLDNLNPEAKGKTNNFSVLCTWMQWCVIPLVSKMREGMIAHYSMFTSAR